MPWLLLSLLCNGVHTALSAQLSATASGPDITAVWVLEPGDPLEAGSSFTVQELDIVGTVQGGVSNLITYTYTPNQISTGTLEWEAEVTGIHQVRLSVNGAIFAESNDFIVASAPLAGKFDSQVTTVQPTITSSGTNHIVTSTSTITAVSKSTVTTVVNQSMSSHVGRNVGPIVGGVIGGVAGFSTTLILVVFLVRRRLQRQSHLENTNGIVAPYPMSSTLVPRHFKWAVEQLMSRSNSVHLPPPRENGLVDVPPMYTES